MTDTGKPPVVLWLQWRGDDYDTTWSSDKTDEDDTAYIDADVVRELVEAGEAVFKYDGMPDMWKGRLRTALAKVTEGNPCGVKDVQGG